MKKLASFAFWLAAMTVAFAALDGSDDGVAATRKWVREYVKSEKPYSGGMRQTAFMTTNEYGEAELCTITWGVPTNRALVVVESNVAAMPTGTVYAVVDGYHYRNSSAAVTDIYGEYAQCGWILSDPYLQVVTNSGVVVTNTLYSKTNENMQAMFRTSVGGEEFRSECYRTGWYVFTSSPTSYFAMASCRVTDRKRESLISLPVSAFRKRRFSLLDLLFPSAYAYHAVDYDGYPMEVGGPYEDGGYYYQDYRHRGEWYFDDGDIGEGMCVIESVTYGAGEGVTFDINYHPGGIPENGDEVFEFEADASVKDARKILAVYANNNETAIYQMIDNSIKKMMEGKGKRNRYIQMSRTEAYKTTLLEFIAQCKELYYDLVTNFPDEGADDGKETSEDASPYNYKEKVEVGKKPEKKTKQLDNIPPPGHEHGPYFGWCGNWYCVRCGRFVDPTPAGYPSTHHFVWPTDASGHEMCQVCDNEIPHSGGKKCGMHNYDNGDEGHTAWKPIEHEIPPGDRSETRFVTAGGMMGAKWRTCYLELCQCGYKFRKHGGNSEVLANTNLWINGDAYSMARTFDDPVCYHVRYCDNRIYHAGNERCNWGRDISDGLTFINARAWTQDSGNYGHGHVMRLPEYLGLRNEYSNENEKVSSKCMEKNICAHSRWIGENGVTNNCGCGWETWIPTGHVFPDVVEAVEIAPSNNYSHAVQWTCDNGCGYSHVTTNSHKFGSEFYTNINESAEFCWKVQVCSEVEEHDGEERFPRHSGIIKINPCGFVKWISKERHIMQRGPVLPGANDYEHLEVESCQNCGYTVTNSIQHEIYEPEKWPEYSPSTVVLTNSPWACGCLATIHYGKAKCSICGKVYYSPSSLPCQYSFKLNDKGAGIGTCRYCGNVNAFSSHFAKDPETGEIMDFGSRDLGDFGHGTAHYYKSEYLQPTNAIYYQAHGLCSQFYAYRGHEYPPGSDICKWCHHRGLPTTLKITDSSVQDRQFIRLFQGTLYVVFDGMDPILYVGDSAFMDAFWNCPNLSDVLLGEVRQADDGAFSGAFSNCAALAHVNFASLASVGARTFAGSFCECPRLASVDFTALTEAGVESFAGAFVTAGTESGLELSMPALTNAFARAFLNAFESSGVTTFSAPNLRRIYPGAFASDGQCSVTNLVLSRLETVPTGSVDVASWNRHISLWLDNTPSVVTNWQYFARPAAEVEDRSQWIDVYVGQAQELQYLSAWADAAAYIRSAAPHGKWIVEGVDGAGTMEGTFIWDGARGVWSDGEGHKITEPILDGVHWLATDGGEGPNFHWTGRGPVVITDDYYGRVYSNRVWHVEQ